ncbi:MAG: T9SS type A sorting domain-containing protein [Saprospiraceae bacterium]|nr:T9SS type A sorting domain-containing protein [Saprospiraceae bacterium]
MKCGACSIIWLILMAGYVSAQHNYDNIWILGYDYINDTLGGGFINAAEGMILDFSKKSPPEPVLHPVPYEMLSINVISHPQTGALQYYTNGCSIINADHVVMDNGDKINDSEVHREYCTQGTHSFHSDFNAMVSLPAPGKENIYYLLHRSRNFQTPVHTDLLFTVIDMNQNGGKGRVISKNNFLKKGKELALGYQTACKHSNGTDWWVVAWERYEPVYHVLLVDKEGVRFHHTGITGTQGPRSAGQATFSPDGRYHVWYDLNSGVHVYDFHRSTGMLSNPRSMVINEPYQYGRGGVSFSPSGRFAYLSARERLYQLDMYADSLEEGLELIDTIDHVTQFGIRLDFTASMLGPDCKIYITTGFSWETLHIIHNPDEKGKACGLEKRGLTLPFPNSNSAIPNMVHYRMDEPEVCSKGTVSVFPHTWYRQELLIYPNPASDILHITAHDAGTVRIYHTSGSLYGVFDIESGSNKIDIAGLPDGLCILEFRSSDGRREVHKFIRI